MPSYKNEYNLNAEMLLLVPTIISMNRVKSMAAVLEFTRKKEKERRKEKKTNLFGLESAVIWLLLYINT